MTTRRRQTIAALALAAFLTGSSFSSAQDKIALADQNLPETPYADPPQLIDTIPAPTFLQRARNAASHPVETLHNGFDTLQDGIDSVISRIMSKGPKWTEQEKECLAKNIYHEAANEPLEGQIAVAVVTENRARHSKYPEGICAVVYQRGTFQAKQTIKVKVSKRKTETKEVWKSWTVCQFSWTCERVKPPRDSDPRYQRIRDAVEEYAAGGFQEWRNKYQASYHYHAYYVNPGWRLNRLARVGAHIFYD